MVAAIDDDPSAIWLEPCFGKGVFLEALNSRGVPSGRIVALDLDREPCAADRLASVRRGVDFFDWSCRTEQRFDKIVGNPPFVQTRHFDVRLTHALQRFLSITETPSANINAWLLFLLGCLRLLKQGGSLTFVLPAAWDYADYARLARTDIPKQFQSFDVHRSWRPLFREVQEGSVVILGRGFGLRPQANRRFEYQSSRELCFGIQTNKRANPCEESGVLRHGRMVRFGELCKIKIGAVTGDNKFFLMSDQDRKRLGLPKTAVMPALTRSRHLLGASITQRHWQELRKSGERTWLFRPCSDLDDLAVRAYLGRSPRKGGCNKKAYKLRTRRNWYEVPLPLRVDGFISGMSAVGPWVCLNRFKNLTASNTLYVVEFLKFTTLQDKAALCLTLLTSEVRAQLRPRRYAAGLTKWEPRDIENLLISFPIEVKGAYAIYKRAIAALLRGEPTEASAIADAFVRNSDFHLPKIQPMSVTES